MDEANEEKEMSAGRWWCWWLWATEKTICSQRKRNLCIDWMAHSLDTFLSLPEEVDRGVVVVNGEWVGGPVCLFSSQEQSN